MGSVCTCCRWVWAGSHGKDGQDKKMSEEDTWFEQDSVSLVTARYDTDEIGSDEADGTVKKTVLLRSPRHPHAKLTSYHLQQQQQQEEERLAQQRRRVKSPSVDNSRSSHHTARTSESGGEERPRSWSSPHERRTYRHHHSNRDEGDGRPRHQRRSNRSSSLEVEESHRALHTGSQSVASDEDADTENVDSFLDSSRSHRSSSASSSSPKASSRTGSPQKKQRYGRKHYRADAKRK